METIFMNNENSRTDESDMFRLIQSGKLDLKNSNKDITLAYWKNIKSACNSNNFKISAPV